MANSAFINYLSYKEISSKVTGSQGTYESFFKTYEHEVRHTHSNDFDGGKGVRDEERHCAQTSQNDDNQDDDEDVAHIVRKFKRV